MSERRARTSRGTKGNPKSLATLAVFVCWPKTALATLAAGCQAATFRSEYQGGYLGPRKQHGVTRGRCELWPFSLVGWVRGAMVKAQDQRKTQPQRLWQLRPLGATALPAKATKAVKSSALHPFSTTTTWVIERPTKKPSCQTHPFRMRHRDGFGVW